MKPPLSKAKAKTILKDGRVQGKKLTERQKKFMGLIASGRMPKTLGDIPQSERKKITL